MTKFETGKTYTFTFIGDSDSCVPCKVISRTEKTVTIQVRNDEPVRKKIHVWDDCEQCYPMGQYSMNPILGADREKIVKKKIPHEVYLDPKTCGNIVGGYNGQYRDNRMYDRDVRYIQAAPMYKSLEKLSHEMMKKDMAGGYWYNEINRIINMVKE